MSVSSRLRAEAVTVDVASALVAMSDAEAATAAAQAAMHERLKAAGYA